MTWKLAWTDVFRRLSVQAMFLSRLVSVFLYFYLLRNMLKDVSSAFNRSCSGRKNCLICEINKETQTVSAATVLQPIVISFLSKTEKNYWSQLHLILKHNMQRVIFMIRHGFIASAGFRFDIEWNYLWYISYYR